MTSSSDDCTGVLLERKKIYSVVWWFSFREKRYIPLFGGFSSEKKDIFRCLEVFLLVRWRFQQCRPSIPALAPQLNVSDSHRLNLTVLIIIRLLIDMYIFEFWAIQLEILLVPGRCRVPIGYIFMPQVVENWLSV